jgi:hypothetical protein
VSFGHHFARKGCQNEKRGREKRRAGMKKNGMKVFEKSFLFPNFANRLRAKNDHIDELPKQLPT